MKTFWFFVFALFLLSGFHVQAAERLAVGLNFIGGQIRYHLSPRWVAEGRYLTGTEDAKGGEVKAVVVGLRGYRFFGLGGRFRFFLGAEAASVSAKQAATNFKHRASPPALSAAWNIA
ncbi:MAG: hypothetical protein HY547_06585 [Elusimicrobia bacterium]|nr:hypothetical protein [Elusimicrobiota bacterium]